MRNECLGNFTKMDVRAALEKARGRKARGWDKERLSRIIFVPDGIHFSFYQGILLSCPP
jgi:hypothetical protein